MHHSYTAHVTELIQTKYELIISRKINCSCFWNNSVTVSESSLYVSLISTREGYKIHVTSNLWKLRGQGE